MANKRYLFTPGPTPVPPQVLEAMSRPIIHHRSSDFREILQRTFNKLREVYRTESDVLYTGGMESAISNLDRATVWSSSRPVTSASAGLR